VVAALVFPLALVGCADEVDRELDVRGCLFPSTAVIHAERLAGREVAVCGSVSPQPEVLWLSDGERPQRAIAVHLPARTEEPGILRTRERLDAWRQQHRRVAPYGRFHGRLIHTPGFAPTLQVQRVDWLDGHGAG
jgi:hypothetical protein